MSNQKTNFPAAPDSAARNGSVAAAPAVAGKPGNGGALADRVDPEALLLSLSRSVFPRMIVYSTIFHVLLIGLSSINFIQLCFKYDSLHPRQVIKRLDREEADKKAKADEDARIKAAQEAVKKKSAATPAKNASAPTPATPTEGAPTATPGETAPDGKEPVKPKSKIEQEIEKTSTERPNKPSISLDNANDLE